MKRFKQTVLRKKKTVFLVLFGLFLLIIARFAERAILSMTVEHSKKLTCVDSFNHSGYKDWVSENNNYTLFAHILARNLFLMVF